MAQSTEAAVAPAGTSQPILFGGTPRNLVPGTAMVLASVAAFVMDLTHVFFAEAMAWTFLIWGVLLVMIGLFDIYQTFAVTDEGLVIRNKIRFWSRGKVWGWAEINRLEVAVGKKDRRRQDAMLRIYRTAQGELTIEREDRAFDAELAQAIIERAGLQPAANDNPQDLAQLSVEHPVTYTWQ
jgi:hypothetical protein